MFPNLLFVLASLPGLGTDTAPDSEVAQIRPVVSESGFLELAQGRLSLVGEGAVQQYMGATPEFAVADNGHMEMGATGRAVLRWTGHGSFSFTGSAAFEWNGSPYKGVPASLIDFDHVEVDVRKGELGLLLPGGVLLIARRAALELRSSSSGMFGVHHLGGSEAALIVPGPGAPERRPLTAGQWIWIDPDEYLGNSRFESILADSMATPDTAQPVETIEVEPQTTAEAQPAKPLKIVLAPLDSIPVAGGKVPLPEPVEQPLALPISIPLIEWVPFAIPEAPLPEAAPTSPWQVQLESVQSRSQMDLSGYSLAPVPVAPLDLLEDFE